MAVFSITGRAALVAIPAMAVVVATLHHLAGAVLGVIMLPRATWTILEVGRKAKAVVVWVYSAKGPVVPGFSKVGLAARMGMVHLVAISAAGRVTTMPTRVGAPTVLLVALVSESFGAQDAPSLQPTPAKTTVALWRLCTNVDRP